MSLKIHFLNKRLHGNALYVVLMVGVIVAILLGSFLMLAHYQRLFQYNNLITAKNISSIDQTFFNYPKSKDSLEIISEYWGGYSKVLIKDEDSNLMKVALLSGKKDSVYPSIYLEDHQSPLVLAGNATVEGRLDLPEGYWKPGAVNGQYFTGNTIIENISISDEVPVLSPEWIDYVGSLLKSNNLKGRNIDSYHQKLHNSFLEPTRILQTYGGNFLASQLTGNIIIRDDVGIRISANSKLKDVVLVAPDIKIDKGFKGNIHCIANHIQIEDDVSLEYPSSVIAIEDKAKQSPDDAVYPDLKIGNNSVIKGFAIFLNDNSNLYDKRDVNISLGINSMLLGDIYNKGYLEIKGEVTGSIYTSYFMYDSDKGGKYINYIYNAKVSSNELKSHYVGTLPFHQNKDYIVASWLY